jgi:LPS sulfotransferase NodH
MINPRCYIIAATYRSGSTLLGETLAATGVAGGPQEFFHPLNETPLALENYLEFVQETIRSTSTTNGVFGAKFLWHHVAYLKDKTLLFPKFAEKKLNAFQTLNALFANLKFVFLTRRDKLAQAISLTRARQTGEFHRYEGGPFEPIREPVYDEEVIHWNLRKSRMDDISWRMFFEAFSVKPFPVEYETFLTRKEETIREILGFLGVDIPEPLHLPAPRLKKLSDGVNAEWRRRFLEKHPELERM